MNANLKKTEIITVASGKGGTGKSLITACLGWVLTMVGKRVLMVDGDPGTDGLSLFLLGPHGWRQLDSLKAENTFAHALRLFSSQGRIDLTPAQINRDLKTDDFGDEESTHIGDAPLHDHGVTYQALITAKTIYGDYDDDDVPHPVPELGRDVFRKAIAALFDYLKRQDNPFDYILVDTRGGFAAETTDICALSDSFIVVTEADVTSFHQDYNLMRHIQKASGDLGTKPLLRAFIVNKATETDNTSGRLNLENMEQSFRLELERAFPINYNDTYPIPLSIDAVKAYKTHRIPFIKAPASHFSYSLLTAFASILRIVTERWEEQQVKRWNRLSEMVDNAVKADRERIRIKNEEKTSGEKKTRQLEKEVQRLSERIKTVEYEKKQLERTLQEVSARYEREISRTNHILSKTTSSQPQTAENRPDCPTPKPKATPASPMVEKSMGRRYLAVIALALLAVVVAIGTYLVYSSMKGNRWTPAEMIAKLYSPDTPPPAKAILVLQLYQSGYKDYNRVDLSSVDLSKKNLQAVSFRSARLEGINFQGTDLSAADLQMADMRKADLSRADLSRADLRGANLSGADLSYSTLSGATLDKADLTGANIDQTDITDKQLAGAIRR
jgi:MinD-like ATPase involved in chromosome partitioning or flagellar assembly